MIARSVGVHDGPFHADEVTACALLILFNLIDREYIFRTRDVEILNRCEFLCDVGWIYDPKNKRFDHHQVEYKGKLSSAGMVLLYLKEEKIIPEEFFHFFNETLVSGVDAFDIGEATFEKNFSYFSDVIENFLPIEYSSEEEINEAFYQALDFTLGHLKRLKIHFEYLKSCENYVKEIMYKSDLVLIFDRPVAWQEPFFNQGGEKHKALFVIMPADQDWKLRAIPPSWEKRMEVRCPLPKAWAGLQGEELKKVSHINGAIFCHKGRFISKWKTKEDAIQAFYQALEEKKNEK